ncbi:unnamed protein product [Durusdinium trenchii]|uniref:Uncharacterized protein n=1 Tax=Durusdinium trenchii TaxID=1381693 RepID=A0ABP0MVI6_9DINO
MLATLALLQSAAAAAAEAACDAVGICECQAKCSVNGFQLSEGHPDCSASLDGSPQDVLNPKGMQQYDAAVRGNEEQALCDLLHCRLDCIQHCSGQLEAFTEQCEGINSMLPNCRVNCATNSPNTSTRELAVCLVGQLRGVCKAEDFSSLFNIVLANFASVDVFLVFPDESCHKDVAVFKAAASIFRHNDLRVFPHCQSDELPPAETQFMQWFLTHEWWATHWHGLGYGGNNNTPALRRMMLSGKHSSACSKKLEIQSPWTKYDFVARVRPDVEWFSFVDRNSLKSTVPGSLLTNFVAMPIQGVVEDTFAIGSWNDMQKYFSFYQENILNVDQLELTNVPWCVVHATLRNSKHCKKLFPENLLEEHLRSKDLQIQKRQKICFERVAPCMQRRNHYCSKYKQHQRGYFQSHPRDFLKGDRDFFLTASGSYADYDTILAARVVHFFLSEAVRLGHPPRLVDMGCGRGSYVEVFKSWGFPVIGIDGNAVITRSIAKHSFLWDLTDRIDLKRAFENDKRLCNFFHLTHNSKEEQDHVKEVFTAIGHGDLRLSVFAVVPQIHATHYWASKHPEGHAEEALMDEETMMNYLCTLCCADMRCAAFAFTEDGGALLSWFLANSTDIISFQPEGGHIWYQDSPARRRRILSEVFGQQQGQG